MDQYGIMLYGFSLTDASRLGKNLSNTLSTDLILISASGNEESVVEEILENGGSELFEDKPESVLIFLGFDDAMIDTVLKNYPRDIKRPIFCGLTESNVRWKLSYLLEHLREEKAKSESL